MFSFQYYDCYILQINLVACVNDAEHNSDNIEDCSYNVYSFNKYIMLPI